MGKESRANYGTVVVKLGGEEITLEPTLKALDKIENRWGGLRQALEAAGSMSARSAALIIQAGGNIGQREAADLAEKVFHEGVANVSPQVIRYLSLLMNPSGKEPDDSEVEDSGE